MPAATVVFVVGKFDCIRSIQSLHPSFFSANISLIRAQILSPYCWHLQIPLKSVVSESRFFNLETRMRVSPIQSRSSRRDREFLTLTLRLRDETEKKFPPISGIETRSRFIIFTLRLRDENENSLDLISFFETRPRILKLAIFPWNQAWTASLFCMQFLGG